MKYVEDRILKDGVVIGDDILKVNSFLNEQIDTEFVVKVCEYFASEFKDVDKILTIETSGVAYAIMTALNLGNVPVVVARKSKSKIIDPNNVYVAKIKSFTRGYDNDVTVTKNFLKEGERVLIVDDFLAEGNAAMGLIGMANEAKVKVVGFCTVIEKIFQGGRAKIENLGIKVVAGASVTAFENGKPKF